MALRLYFIPVIHLTTEKYEVPKYLPHRFNAATSGLEGLAWSWATYLLGDTGLIASDTATAQHNILNAQTDVIALPTNLDSTLTQAARDKARNLLEGWNVPALWIQTGMTYRAALRTLMNIWQFHNRYVGRFARKLFDGSISLDMTVSQMSQGVRNDLQTAAESLNLDYSAVTGATTIRQLLKGVSDQLGDVPYSIGGVTI